jgi:hypothetical protein
MRSTTASRWSNLSSEGAKGACQKRKSAAIGAPLPGDIGLFPGSSVVEQLTVNQLVGGSNPSRGAILCYVQLIFSNILSLSLKLANNRSHIWIFSFLASAIDLLKLRHSKRRQRTALF